MKKNKLYPLGTSLLIIGLILVIVCGILFLTYKDIRPDELIINDTIRTEKALTLQTEADRNRDLLVKRLPSVISFYRDRDPERLSFFETLKADLEAGLPITDDVYHRLRGMRSLEGEETEVQHLYNCQNLATIIRDNENAAARWKADLGKGETANGFSSAMASVSNGGWIFLIVLGIGCIAAGLTLNHSYQTKKVMGQFFLYLFLVIGAVIMVFPFYWMVSSSLKTRIEVSRFPPMFTPGNWLNLENYRIAFRQAPFAKYFLNSVIVCVCSVALVTFTTILGAFAFTRLSFPGRELIFSALLSLMMLPFEMLVITNFSTIITLGLRDTLAALVAPFISSIFYTYIMRNFFMSIPESLYWSARVDGCSNWRYLWKVMVPIARPSLVTVVLLNALASWNSFMWPLLVITSTSNRTLPFGLYAFTTEAGAFQELIMSASTVVVLPMIILFLFARNQILRGVARGGVKG